MSILDRKDTADVKSARRRDRRPRRPRGPELFNDDHATDLADLVDPDELDGVDATVVDAGQWDDLKGAVPRGLRRNRLLDVLGWYEIHERDTPVSSTRQVVATNPALMQSQPPFGGPPVGIEESTGMWIGSDPFVLYALGVITSINVVLCGDVGVSKSTFVKNHYVQDQIYAGRQVCCFDRKRNADAKSEYDGVTRVVEASGKRVARIRIDRAGNGARINILDPQIIAHGNEQEDTVGQDELLDMVATLIHGPLSSRERFCLSIAHKRALAVAAAEHRDPDITDVVDAMFRPQLTQLPDALRESDHVAVHDLIEWGLDLALDLQGALDGSLSGLIDGPTRGADGADLDLDADLIVVDTSSLQDGSTGLMLVMAIMATFISSVWSMSPRQCVVVIEEGYSADFPSVASILKSVAKRGRGIGVCLVSVFHHLSDVAADSPLASLIREAGVIHLMRQAQLEQAEHTAKLLGVVNLTSAIQRLNKGEHILLEGGQPEVRPPRIVCHVRTDLDRWTNYTDRAITGGADAPTSPFPADHQPVDAERAFTPAPEKDDYLDEEEVSA